MVKNSFGLHVAKWQTRKWSYNDHVLIKIKWTRCIHSSYIHETALEKSMDYGPGNGISHVLRLDSGFLNTCLNICSWIPRSLFENKEYNEFGESWTVSRRNGESGTLRNIMGNPGHFVLSRNPRCADFPRNFTPRATMSRIPRCALKLSGIPQIQCKSICLRIPRCASHPTCIHMY